MRTCGFILKTSPNARSSFSEYIDPVGLLGFENKNIFVFGEIAFSSCWGVILKSD